MASITMVGSITFVIASRAAFSFVGRDLKRDRNVIGFHFPVPFASAWVFDIAKSGTAIRTFRKGQNGPVEGAAVYL